MTIESDKLIQLHFSSRGKKFYIGIILAVLSLAACILTGASGKATIVLSLAFLVLAPIKLSCSNRVSFCLNLLWAAVAPFAAIFLSQLLLNVGTGYLNLMRILLGAACVGVLLLFLFLCTMNFRISIIADIVLILLLSAINYVVYALRGSEFAPYDILAAGTAAAVAGQYELVIAPPFIYALTLGAIYCYCGFCIPKFTVKHSRTTIGVCFLAELVLVLGFIFGSSGIKAQHFLCEGSVSNGYILNFVLQLKNMGTDKPETYSSAAIQSLEEAYYAASDTGVPDSKPDIIVIMSESYADLRIIGSDLHTSTEVMPFFDSLQDNTIRGFALVSGYGGGTSNSEYEFLTNNSLGLLPTGCFPFQQYVNDGSISLVSQLEQYGYTSIGTHPQQSKNWMRATVYPSFGFDEAYFIDDYPKENRLREHVSDQEMFGQIVNWYDSNRGNDLFLFGVTMQNHGGYDYTGEDFSSHIHLEGYSRAYPDAEQYLSILNHSDKALEYLITYLQSVEDDVVLVFFGDHLPNLDPEFYTELHGGALDTLQEQMLQYTVPFFIWANFDIEEKDVGLTSLNFLSNYLYETAGLPLPAYNRALKDIQSVIPAMNAFGYYSTSQGAFVPYEEAAGEEAQMLEMYRILQYNSLFDEENRSELFFPSRISNTP